MPKVRQLSSSLGAQHPPVSENPTILSAFGKFQLAVHVRCALRTFMNNQALQYYTHDGPGDWKRKGPV